MKKKSTLLLLSLFTTFLSFAQRMDYDLASKWYLGLNLGGTWHTSDIANKTNIGYGFTLGRTFNFNYGKKFSFDLRGRYLGGYWYGQDKSLTNRTLPQYGDSLFTLVNNFQSQQHRMSLELVLRANGLRDRTGIDAYVFGGVGLTWQQTFADFKDSTFYVYDADQVGQSSYLNSLQDGQFETELVGTTDKWAVNFMPSLGFGLGYQVGKRTTIGIEHKTTFTLRDDFDGYTSDVPRAKNDLYHYTSLYLNFRFKHRKGSTSGTVTTGGTNSVNTVGNYNQANQNCPAPTVVFISPSQNSVVTAETSAYKLQASVANLTDRQGIEFRHNGVQLYSYAYNPTTDKLDINLILYPGVNTFEIKAINSCGVDAETLTVTYTPCTLPKVSIPSSSTGSVSTTNSLYDLNALVQGAEAGSVSVTLNGMNVATTGLDQLNGTLRQSLALSVGRNVLNVSATNACGTASASVTIDVESCITPKVNLITPSASGLVVNADLYNLTLQALNVTSTQQLNLTFNNQQISSYTFNPATGMLSKTVVLQKGVNTIVLRATNNCGTDIQTIALIYNPAPTVTDPAITICHYPTPGSGNPVTMTILQSQWPAHQAHGDQLGACQPIAPPPPPVPDPIITICHYATSGSGNPVTMTILQSQWPAHQAHGDQLGACQPIAPPPPPAPDPTITICHYPTPGSNKPVTMTILQSQWPAHQAHGDQLGACTQLQPPAPEQKMTICHVSPGNPNNPQTIEIPISAWPAHQAHGDQVGACQPIAPPPPPAPDPTITICHYPTPGSNKPVTMTILQSQWPAHQAHGDQLGACTQLQPPAPEQKMTICHIPPGNPNNPQTIEIPISAWPAHQAHGDQVGACQPIAPPPPPPPAPEQKITICHIPPGNPNNPQTIEIPLSAWPAHQAHGDQLGECQPIAPPPPPPPAPEQKITICHIPPGNPNNPQTIEIPLSAWPAHQAHGDQLGECQPIAPPPPPPPAPEQKITICHIPPGNPNNPQTLVIPISAWPAHQAHGDQMGECQPIAPPPPPPPAPEEKITICHIPPGNPNNPQTLVIPISAWPAHQAHGDQMGECQPIAPPPPPPPAPEEKITICHIPPGNPNNPQTLVIPISAWPAHQAHGDQMGECQPIAPPPPPPPAPERNIKICHIPPGNPNNPQTIEIPLSAWPAHQAHGDQMGECKPVEPSPGNGNNSNGNGGNSGNSGNSGGSGQDPRQDGNKIQKPGNKPGVSTPVKPPQGTTEEEETEGGDGPKQIDKSPKGKNTGNSGGKE